MKLTELIAEYEVCTPTKSLVILGESQDIDITGLNFDSRKVVAGDLYFCITGHVHDGHEYAQKALEAGAVALVVERELEIPLTQILVEDTREAMAYISCAFFGFPSKEIKIIGVTGTNGKTTTTQLINQILKTSGLTSESIGTLDGPLTTPEAPNLQSKFRTLANAGVKSIVMEVSSHALSQHRTTGTQFDIGVFTNLSHDHLDYHADIEEYFETKSSLFTPNFCKSAVINTDDPYGLRLADLIDIETVEVSPQNAEVIDERFDGTTLLWNGRKIELQVSGRFNIDNALLAASTCQLFGIEDDGIINGLEAAKPVPGRFEVLEGSEKNPTIIVDYSHTPAGIENVLKAVQRIDSKARTSIVFGCGGNRDSSKRPKMAHIAETFADQVIITSDNPRNEDPEKIIKQAMTGFKNPEAVIIEVDRKSAIIRAITSSQSGEVVVIAGKGDETTQEILGKLEPFNDRVIALNVLQGDIK